MELERVTDRIVNNGVLERDPHMVFRPDAGYDFRMWVVEDEELVYDFFDGAHVPIEESDVEPIKRALAECNRPEILRFVRKYMPPPGGKKSEKDPLSEFIHKAPRGTSLSRGKAHTVVKEDFEEVKRPLTAPGLDDQQRVEVPTSEYNPKVLSRIDRIRRALRNFWSKLDIPEDF